MRVNIEASSQGTSGQHRTGLDTCWANVENIRKQSQSMCYHGQGCILASSKQQSQTLLKRAASTKKLPRCFPCLKTKISCNKPGELTSKQFTKPRSFMEAKMPTPCPQFLHLCSLTVVWCVLDADSSSLEGSHLDTTSQMLHKSIPLSIRSCFCQWEIKENGFLSQPSPPREWRFYLWSKTKTQRDWKESVWKSMWS